jgi:hypothetical protein
MPATKHKSGVQTGARKGERYKLLGDNKTFIFCPVIQGRFARFFLHLAGCGDTAPCEAGLVTPRFWYLIDSVVQWDLESVARGRPSWFPREICVAGGAPPEPGLAYSLAGLCRVGASTRWCGWVKVNR